jgi:hypothetical protein
LHCFNSLFNQIIQSQSQSKNQKMIKLSKLKNNPNNPRKISVLDFEKLKENIVKHPNILKVKPLVIDSWENPILLAGNQRFKALKDLGYEEIPKDWIRTADTLTEKEKNAFVFLDNNTFGEYDYDILKSLYNDEDLKEIESWGTEIPFFEDEPDYSILDDYESEQINDNISKMRGGCKKGYTNRI